MFPLVPPDEIVDQTHANQIQTLKSSAETVGCTQETIQGEIVQLRNDDDFIRGSAKINQFLRD